MTLTQEHVNMLAALLAANERDRPVSPATPGGRSTWHTARRLVAEEGLPASEDWADRLGTQLQRRGLVARKTMHGTIRWTLTEAGLGRARQLTALKPAPRAVAS